MKESYEGHVTDRESVETFHWTKSKQPRQETVEWSRVRYRGLLVPLGGGGERRRGRG